MRQVLEPVFGDDYVYLFQRRGTRRRTRFINFPSTVGSGGFYDRSAAFKALRIHSETVCCLPLLPTLVLKSSDEKCTGTMRPSAAPSGKMGVKYRTAVLGF